MERSRLEFLVLTILQLSKIPVGAGTLNEGLRSKGVNIGEATAGRLLKELQTRGLAEKIGTKGRVLSAKGREYFEELSLRQKLEHPKNTFYLSLQAHDVEMIRHILEARRAVEKEAARLAALRATDADIAHLENLLEEQEQSFSTKKNATEVNEQFHLKIAECSKNPVLIAAISLIRQELKWAPVLGSLTSEIDLDHEDYSHDRIVQAVKERDPTAAEEAMAAHIDRYLLKIRQHSTEKAKPEEGQGSPGKENNGTN